MIDEIKVGMAALVDLFSEPLADGLGPGRIGTPRTQEKIVTDDASPARAECGTQRTNKERITVLMIKRIG